MFRIIETSPKEGIPPLSAPYQELKVTCLNNFSVYPSLPVIKSNVHLVPLPGNKALCLSKPPLPNINSSVSVLICLPPLPNIKADVSVYTPLPVIRANAPVYSPPFVDVCLLPRLPPLPHPPLHHHHHHHNNNNNNNNHRCQSFNQCVFLNPL